MTRGRPFQPGNRFGHGRPKGSPNQKSLQARKLFEEHSAAGGAGIRFLGLTGAVPVEGGVPLIVNGKLIGAVGASGGTSD